MKSFNYFLIGVAVITIIALLMGCDLHANASGNTPESMSGTVVGRLSDTNHTRIYEFMHKGTRCIVIDAHSGTGLSCDFSSARP